MALNLLNMKTPTADGAGSVQAKYTLSHGAREKLRLASHLSGHDMSTIIEWLIMQELVLPENTHDAMPEKARHHPTQEPGTNEEDIDFV